MKLATGIVTAALGLGLMVGSSGAWAGELIAPANLKQMFSGATLYTDQFGSYYYNHLEEWEFKAGGNVKASWEQAATSEQMDPTEGGDDGAWTVRGDRLCITWNKLLKGQENCYLIHTAADHKFADHMYQATNVQTGKQWLFGLER